MSKFKGTLLGHQSKPKKDFYWCETPTDGVCSNCGKLPQYHTKDLKCIRESYEKEVSK